MNCFNCKRNLINYITRPYCVKCGHCKNQHILPVHFDGSYPSFCPECDYLKWLTEHKEKLDIFTKKYFIKL